MLEKISNQNSDAFESMVQDYEEEFSPITGKQKQADGKYTVDLHWQSPNTGFYWKEHGEIVGFVIKDNAGKYSDIGEFYIIPSYRRRGVGKKMAFAIFNAYPGLWQVRQIQGAEAARKFWRNIINEYTKGEFIELTIDDLIWGKVICQRFESKAKSQNFND